MKHNKTAAPQAGNINIEDAIAGLGDAFALAADLAPDALVETDYRVAGYPVRLRVIGTGLAADIDKSMTHLRATDGAEPVLTIEVWDQEVVGPVGQTDWPDDIDPFGIVLVADDDRFVLNQRKSSAMLLDRRESRITGCIRGRGTLFLDERSRPFYRLFSIWLDDRNIQVIHAALAVEEDQGLLFVGRGGSGKSTSSVACFLAGFTFLSDDFVALGQAADGHLVGHSLYATCLLANDHVGRFPNMSQLAHAPHHQTEFKSVCYLADRQDARFAPDARITAVILPKVMDKPKTEFRRAKPMEAMMALAPSSVIILPGAAPNSLDKIHDLVTTVPAYRLEIGHDVGHIAPTVRQICQEIARES